MDSKARVWIDNTAITCRMLDTTEKKARLAAPRPGKLNSFVRLNLHVSGLEQLVDIDGILVDSKRGAGEHLWGVRYLHPLEASVIEQIERAVGQLGRRLMPASRPSTTRAAHAAHRLSPRADRASESPAPGRRRPLATRLDLELASLYRECLEESTRSRPSR